MLNTALLRGTETMKDDRRTLGFIPVLALALLLPLCAAAAYAGNCVSVPAGFVRVEVEAQSDRLLALPFKPFDDLIDSVIGDQLTGPPAAAASDRVLTWDPEEAAYREAVKVDGAWFTDASAATRSWISLGVGDAFWIRNRQEAGQVVVLAGEVVLDPTRTTLFSPVTLFGYPYSTAIRFDRTELGKSWRAGAPEVAGDTIADPALAMSDDTRTLSPGSGYWYGRASEWPLLWTEPRPYTNLFPANALPPRIADISESGQAANVTLTVMCEGVPGEKLDIFYQDLSDTNEFDTTYGWQIAELDIAVEGSTSLAWTDAGGPEREPPSGVFGRCYLIGRADIDSDGDGIPDAREMFLYHSDPYSVPGAGGMSVEAEEAEALAASGKEDEGDRDSRHRGSGRIIYVDQRIGNDSFPGRCARVRDGDGPKRTINAALREAVKGDTVSVAEGVYREKVRVSGVKLTTRGHVVIR